MTYVWCSCTISITFCTGRANQSDAANVMLHIVSVQCTNASNKLEWNTGSVKNVPSLLSCLSLFCVKDK